MNFLLFTLFAFLSFIFLLFISLTTIFSLMNSAFYHNYYDRIAVIRSSFLYFSSDYLSKSFFYSCSLIHLSFFSIRISVIKLRPPPQLQELTRPKYRLPSWTKVKRQKVPSIIQRKRKNQKWRWRGQRSWRNATKNIAFEKIFARV